MTTEEFTFRVRRFDPDAGAAPHYQTYRLDVPRGMTVLEALLNIQRQQDGSLSFRYSCRGAVCGSCAMAINGRPTLACRTQVLSLAPGPITVEPLPHLPVLKDLVVDMAPFLDKYRAVCPWLEPDDELPSRERLMSPDSQQSVEPFSNCILCAVCYGVCPAVGRDPAFLGPAALAANWRFIGDPRDSDELPRLKRAGGQAGVWGCDTVHRCCDYCPKAVRPTDGIIATRRRMVARLLRR